MTLLEVETRPGVWLRIATELRRSLAEGNPFQVARTADGGVAVALCDDSGSWSDVHDCTRIAADVLVRAMTSGDGDPPTRLRDAMHRADVEMCRHGGDDPSLDGYAPACMASLLYINGNEAYVAWLGDGPVWLVRAGRVLPRTRPHLLVNDLIAAGKMTAEEARNSPHKHVTTRALGAHLPANLPQWQADVSEPWQLTDGDRIVVAYRRVVEDLPHERVVELVAAQPELAVSALLDGADPRWECAAIVISVRVELAPLR